MASATCCASSSDRRASARDRRGRPGPDHRVAAGQPLPGRGADRGQHGVGVRPAVGRQQGADPGFAERADQCGNPLAAARVGERVGHLENPRVGGQPAPALAETDRHREQLPPGDLDAQGPGPGRRLVRVGVRPGHDRADQRGVRLPLQALVLAGQQPGQRERGGGALHQRQVAGGRGAAAGQDDPAPVLAPGARHGDQPAGRLVVTGPLGHDHGAGACLEAVKQRRGIGSGGLAGEHAVRQVRQDHRPAREQGRLPEDLPGAGARHRQVGEHLVQPGRGAQLVQLVVDDPGVHRLGDLDERDLPAEHDQRQPVRLAPPRQSRRAARRCTGGPVPPRARLRPPRRGRRRRRQAARPRRAARSPWPAPVRRRAAVAPRRRTRSRAPTAPGCPAGASRPPPAAARAAPPPARAPPPPSAAPRLLPPGPPRRFVIMT